MSVTVRILRVDGAIINEVDFASTGEDCICVDRAGVYRFGPMPGDAAVVERASILEARLRSLETAVDRIQAQNTGDRSDLRDMGATLVDKARARLVEAQAERVELEVAATRRALNLDDSPLAGFKVSVDHEAHRPGESILRITFDDGAGRTAAVALPFALALKLSVGIGRAVAERLDAAGER